jgi:DNA-binding transcriptional MerR regulator
VKLIKTIRASGLPIKDIDNYVTKYNNIYDSVLKENNIVANKFLTPEESSKIDEVLKNKETELKKQFPVEEFWPMMTTKKSWIEAIKQYGPIVVTYNKEEKVINYIILDIPIDS